MEAAGCRPRVELASVLVEVDAAEPETSSGIHHIGVRSLHLEKPAESASHEVGSHRVANPRETCTSPEPAAILLNRHPAARATSFG